VVQQVVVSQGTLAPARVDVVGKEVASMEMTTTGNVTAFAVAGDDFEREVLQALAEGFLPPGREIAEGSEVIEPQTVTVTADGVTWTVMVSAAHQFPANPSAIRRLLAGRRADEARDILAAQDLRLEALERAPSWWPLMPLLDGRIDVRIEGEPVTQGR
jgi:hypothetical protein